MSDLTRFKISSALTGRTDSVETRKKKSEARTGEKNPFFGKPLTAAIEAAAILSGKKVWAYSQDGVYATPDSPYRSIRGAAKALGVSATTLTTYLDSGTLLNGHSFYRKPK